MRWPQLALLALAACGRFGFDAHAPAASADAPAAVDASADAFVAHLACGHAATGASGVSANADQLVIAPSSTGLVALSTDDSQVLRAWTFAIGADGTAVAGALGTQLDTDATGTLALAPAGAGALAAWSTSTGTELQPLAPTGAPAGAVAVVPAAPASRAVAASGIDGALAVVTIAANGEVDGTLIDATGSATGAPVVLVAAGVGAGNVEIAPAATGYALLWTDAGPSPNAKRLALLGPDLTVVAGPVTANTDPYDAENGQVAWDRTSGHYLAAWQHKDMAGADEVNIRVYDASLSPLAATSTTILSNTGGPRVASDGAGFWLTARGYSPDAVVTVAIAPDGTVGAQGSVPVAALAWAITARGGQPVVAWLTAGQLSLEAPCL